MNFIPIRMSQLSNNISFARICRRVISTKRDLKVGDKATLEKVITEDDVKSFIEVSLDRNPLHSGEKCVVHGALLNGLVSATFGTKLPGPGTILVEQHLRFPNPCYVGEKVTVTVEVVSVRKIIECSFRCSVGEKIVLHGTARMV